VGGCFLSTGDLYPLEGGGVKISLSIGLMINNVYVIYSFMYFRVSQYGARCQWLKDDKFIKDLEEDSVDTEILDEELQLLQEKEPKTSVHYLHHYLRRQSRTINRIANS